MNTHTALVMILAAPFALGTAACVATPADGNADADDRAAAAGKADGQGLPGACGTLTTGQSADGCYCDLECCDYGDCCQDRMAECGSGGGLVGATFTRTLLDPISGQMTTPHPEKFVVEWYEDGTGSGRVFRTKLFATGEPEPHPCGSAKLSTGSLTFQGECGLSNTYNKSLTDPSEPFETREMIYETAAGFTRGVVDPISGHMLTPHPEKFVVDWYQDGTGSGRVFRTQNYATGEPEPNPCGSATRSATDMVFQGECGLSNIYTKASTDPNAPFEIRERIDL
ncbi:MAG: hypothetical protein JRI23_16420 [Deltaproteobacteria bacterium]|jgi:hypothetical protein|nr:hypothetical protein [Deltaproteobacteria bacterium]MBW2533360.1 hypothetical protein [Deltaproteobacteria bacterium]